MIIRAHVSGFGTLPTQIGLVLRGAQHKCVSTGGKAALERRKKPTRDPAEALVAVLTPSFKGPLKASSRKVASPSTSPKCFSSLKVNKL